jgi:hypothetical protein
MAEAGGINAEVKALGIVLNAVEGLTEEQRQFVLKTALERFNVSVAVQPVPKTSPASVKADGSSTVEGSDTTPKHFMATKRPTNDVQRIACLAFYLTHHRDQPHFKTVDLTTLNVESASPKMGNPAQAVANATKVSGYLAAAGGGKKQLTTLGEQIVAALPDQEVVRQVIQDRPVTRSQKVKKARKKKDKV